MAIALPEENSPDQQHPATPAARQPYFRERLWPGVGTFLAAALIIPAVALVVLPLLPAQPQSFWQSSWMAVLASLGAYALLVVWLRIMSPLVLVSGGVLRAGPAHIPLSGLGRCEVFAGTAAKEQLGLRMDARCWRLTRGWIRPLVRVEVTDPNDLTPYWLISSRRPQALADALKSSCPNATGAAEQR